ncbi:MAG: hypothetical protein ACK5XN_30435 [Bacteroidota bacterium]|jgi:hypothetical protein
MHVEVPFYLFRLGLNDSEIILCIHLAYCTPPNYKEIHFSNADLLAMTGWSMGKLQATKKSLSQKGILKIKGSTDPESNGTLKNSYALCSDHELMLIHKKQMAEK